MYLYPELLPKVPEGTAPFSVSDAVFDAVDVEASSLNIAELFHIPSVELREDVGDTQQGDGDGPSSAADTTSQSPMTFLAFLLATNRLQVAGLTAEMLQRGKFSSGSILEELLKLKDRAGLNDNEAKAIMSNHFINLLAWRTLKEMNGQDMDSGKGDPAPEWQRGHLWPREEGTPEKETGMGGLRPSDDPWCDNTYLQSGVFVSANETNVEKRIELIDTLSNLYRRPWKTLQSQGAQTERFTPGVINETSPYVNPAKLPGAMLDVEKDLGWKPSTPEDALNSHWMVRVTSSITETFQVVPVNGRFLHFGRDTGVTSAAHGTVTNVHVGLSAFTAHPEFLSPHHFSLAVLPARPAEDGGEMGAAARDGDDGAEPSSLWLINYGRNGTHIMGKQWCLGDMVQLEFGDILQPTDDIRIVIGSSMQSMGGETQDEGVSDSIPQTLLEG